MSNENERCQKLTKLSPNANHECNNNLYITERREVPPILLLFDNGTNYEANIAN